MKQQDNTKSIIIVCGGQWGSEAKGMVAAALCKQRQVDYAVRTGGVNAGHTVYYEGLQYKMQQLPTGWVNPNTKLVLGPGAYINYQIFGDEMNTISEVMHEPQFEDRIMVDHRAGTHHSGHTEISEKSGRHHSMGATGKGCSEAMMDRIRLRGQDLGIHPFLYGGNIKIDTQIDTEKLLNDAYDQGKQILLEGTQGQLLDILLGPWPYTTHKPTGPAQWLVEAGLSPNLKLEIVMVARTYPIRVAGNSGPMPNEIDWVKVNEDMGYARVSKEAIRKFEVERDHVYSILSGLGKDENFITSELHAETMKRLDKGVASELSRLFEFTTVTRKLRRVARWDKETMKASVRQVRPNYVVLTFLNYVFPELWGKTDIHEKALRFVRMREEEMGVEIRYVTTGPEEHHMIELRP